MLLSMTGFGEARRQCDGWAVSVEVRTINSRYFKLTLRSTEGFGWLDPQIEGVVRERIRRGTIQVNVRVDRARSVDQYRINVPVLAAYREQLESLHREWQVAGPVPPESLLLLPGVCNEEASAGRRTEEDWPLIREALVAAIDAMDRMRQDEGRAMAADLLANSRAVGSCLSAIEQRAPLVAGNYRTRLEERIKKTLSEYQITLEPADLIKEVSLFSERSDISEETVRLRSHLEQFDGLVNSRDSEGRKLEFLTQEMFREANTIGSKANDVEIARQVIEVKAAIERIREMIQNVE